MNIQSIVENEITQDDCSVWCLKGDREFGYSDGASSEKYLRQVFTEASDLSTRSAELECRIKDWSSEYHLTIKRAQLLSGFSFDRSLRVLEVGCGCGAITRHLGENFDQVISVEGNINRARLARLRTRDLQSVSILCAPFQEIRFSQKFDIIFCIGVFEYSASFIQGDDPYDAALRYFSDMLTPEGLVVIAIENQFGLKYFSGMAEDHLGVKFEGLEGYRRCSSKARTFGKVELELRLKKYFPQINFYYPYPDYKVPDCVISSEFLSSGCAGELVSQMRSRDYSGSEAILWDESVAALELARNGMLDFFANSFLVFAGHCAPRGVAFEQLAVIFSSGRKHSLSTRTCIRKGEDDQIRVVKRAIDGSGIVASGPLKLVNTDTPWIDAQSLQTVVMLRARARTSLLPDIFSPCRSWIDLLTTESSIQDGVRYLDGSHIDSIWPNAYVTAVGCEIVDKEWIWQDRIRMNVVVIRAIYDFLSKIETKTPFFSRSLSIRSGKAQICDIANVVGVQLVDRDFVEFIKLESELQWIVFGVNKTQQFAYLRWFLVDRSTLRFFRLIKHRLLSVLMRIHTRISDLL
jgi:SAM-dependent methyltransferase